MGIVSISKISYSLNYHHSAIPITISEIDGNYIRGSIKGVLNKTSFIPGPHVDVPFTAGFRIHL